MSTSAQTSPRETAPDPVDLHVGARIRLRRRQLGVSQEKLADALGLTFQQVQKYERGTNRVSASKLWQASVYLQTPVAWFFAGLETASGDLAEDAVGAELAGFAADPSGARLVEAWPRIPGAHRRLVAQLADVVANRGAELAAFDQAVAAEARA